jgi:hypothetical protein
VTERDFNMKPNTDTWYDVYFLIDPFIMQVFYVGVSEDSMQRYLQHIQMRDNNARKNERISAIIAHGSLPLMYSSIKVKGTKGALFYEGLYTEVFLCCGQPLTNSVMKVNDRDDQYIRHRDALIAYYKKIDNHGGSFDIIMSASVLTPENARLSGTKKKLDAIHADKVKILEDAGCDVVTVEHKDIYGTHRKIEATRDENFKSAASCNVDKNFTVKQALADTLQKIRSFIRR